MGKRALKRPGDSETAALDALAERVLEARGDFESRLHKKSRRFPREEFDRLWLRVTEYSTAIKGLDWLHRDVAREISGFREYLQLELFKTPSDVVRRADQMESILFADQDPYLDHDDPSDLEAE